jgi:small subunit ribosomal protein S17
MKIFTGKVISTKMAKTATVAVERTVVHPMYKKRYKKIKKFHVQDDLGTQVGQNVKFAASKPISKLKKWKIIEIVNIGGKKETKTK